MKDRKRFILLAAIVLSSCFSAGADSVRDKRWHEDLQELASHLPKNDKALLSSPVKTERFKAAIAELDKAVPQLDDSQITVGIMKAVAGLGASHTMVPPFGNGFHSYPIQLAWFPDGMHVITAPRDAFEVLGARLVQIADTPVADVLGRLSAVVSHENTPSFESFAPQYVVVAEVLSGLRITPAPDHATFVFETLTGNRLAKDFKAQPENTEMRTMRLLARPLYTTRPELAYWFEYLADSGTLFFEYRQCREMPRKPFQQFTAELMDFAGTHKVERLVVDLRQNGGGNSAVLEPFLVAIARNKRLREPGRLFVIIGRGTMSSGLFNAVDLKLKNQAILVGEASGGKPNHFGNVKEIQLTKSRLRVHYSAEYWRTWPDDAALSLLPDIRADDTWADYLAGNDPALRAILQQAK